MNFSCPMHWECEEDCPIFQFGEEIVRTGTFFEDMDYMRSDPFNDILTQSYKKVHDDMEDDFVIEDIKCNYDENFLSLVIKTWQ